MHTYSTVNNDIRSPLYKLLIIKLLFFMFSILGWLLNVPLIQTALKDTLTVRWFLE